jgi:hypothetical protein
MGSEGSGQTDHTLPTIQMDALEALAGLSALLIAGSIIGGLVWAWTTVPSYACPECQSYRVQVMVTDMEEGKDLIECGACHHCWLS